MRFLLPALLISALITAGCGSGTTTPTKTPAPATVTESFVGTLKVSGSAFYSFSLTQYGTINLTLNALKVNNEASTAQVALALGNPAAVDCLPLTTVTTGSGTSPQITGSYEAGVYCVRITDNVPLETPATFDISIGHP